MDNFSDGLKISQKQIKKNSIDIFVAALKILNLTFESALIFDEKV